MSSAKDIAIAPAGATLSRVGSTGGDGDVLALLPFGSTGGGAVSITSPSTLTLAIRERVDIYRGASPE